MSKRIYVQPASEPHPEQLTISNGVEGVGSVGYNIPTQKLNDSWAAWGELEGRIRAFLNSAITTEEWAAIESVALTQPAKNGLAELKSALGSWPGNGKTLDSHGPGMIAGGTEA